MNYSVYDPSTGKILSNISSSNQELLDLNLAGKTYIEGYYNGEKYYISNGQAVEMESNPSIEFVAYSYDWSTHSWVLNTQKTEDNVRQFRNTLLTAVDNVSPVRWNSLTQEQQQELQTYRQALLDITTQQGFPTDINWPNKPAWL